MKRSISSALAFVFAVATVVGQSPAGSKAPRAGTAPAASSSQSSAPVQPRPSPAPTPTPFNPGVAPAPLNSPQYSPAQLDFGALWDGESAKRTLTLTPPMGGVVTVSFPGGGQFWLTEYRVFGPPRGGSKNTPTGQNVPVAQWVLKSRNTLPVGKSTPGYYPGIVEAGDQIQVDIVFQPVSHPKGIAFGPPEASIVIEIIGPGPTKSWAVKIPAHGAFNGSRSQ